MLFVAALGWLAPTAHTENTIHLSDVKCCSMTLPLYQDALDKHQGIVTSNVYGLWGWNKH